MAAAANLFPFSAPPTAAPELSDYTQFVARSVPEGSGASRAHEGFIRPFSDDATARRVLRAIEEGIPLQVFGGRLDVELSEPSDHSQDPYLTDMAEPFTILLLEFEGTERPRTYMLDPHMVPRFNQCYHLRHDKSIEIDGKPLAALCVYSGAVQRFESNRSRLEQQLDQTATYLAKYLIWLRTRQLYRRTDEGPRLVRRRAPNGEITMAEVSRSLDLFWDGYWPGPCAPSGSAGHLATIEPDGECWCWSGKAYGECCRPRERKLMAELEDRRIRAEFVWKLMAAVHSRLQLERWSGLAAKG
jgi:hypothetical protein